MATTRPKSCSDKNTPSITKVSSKPGRVGPTKADPDSPSPRPNLRKSFDRSPSSADSKPRRSPLFTSPEKQTRVNKGSELAGIQEELKLAKERLVSIEKEKALAVKELKEAKNGAEEANEKLALALLAKQKAEESLGIEKFRAEELELASMESTRKKEAELDDARNKYEVDLAALVSAKEELQRVKHELMMTTDVKNDALSHAENAMKIAETNAEKVEMLSTEVTRLKSLLDSQLVNKSSEAQELVGKLDAEIVALTREIEKAKESELKLVVMEAVVEELKSKVNDSKKAEANATNLVDEFRKKVESLESKLEENIQLEKCMQESLDNTKKELEKSSSLLIIAESEVSSLRSTVEELELAVACYKEDTEKSKQCLETAQQEALEIGKVIEALKSEIHEVEQEKRQVVNNERTLTSNLEILVEDKNKLLTELGIVREEAEEAKKAMEGLTSALHEVSTEARETKESFILKQAEVNLAHSQINELEATLKDMKEAYEVKLVEARNEIESLKKSVEESETEADNSRAEWSAKEISLLNSIKKSEEEIGTLKEEMIKLVESFKLAENEAKVAKDDVVQAADKLKQAETKMSLLIESMEEAKAENLNLKEKLSDEENAILSVSQAAKEKEVELLHKLSKAEEEVAFAYKTAEELKTCSSQLKERLLDKENELQSITQENDELRTREDAALEKIQELTILLTEANEKNSEDKIKINPVSSPEKPKSLDSAEKYESEVLEHEMKLDDSGNLKSDENKTESTYCDLDKKLDCESLGDTNRLSSDIVENGVISPTKQQLQKKKKALLQKFGSLLKKKSNNSK